MGLWFAAVMPGIDRFSKRFFKSYFFAFVLCCVFTFIDLILSYYPVPIAAVYVVVVLEDLCLSMPVVMLTEYLLYCLGEKTRSGSYVYLVLGLWAVYITLLASAPITGVFTYVSQDNQYYRGPLYPLMLLPMIMIQLLNLVKTLKGRKQLSRRVFFSFTITLLAMTAALIVNLFVDALPLFDISYVLSALSMYGLILSDQVEQNLRRQQEIAQQRASIMILQMRPHFIYNTLMSIYSLCDQDPQKARQITMDFTKYLRKNFNAVASESTIPFSAELEHTRAYLAVEQAQFEDMLLVDLDTQFTNFRLPPLTLQPIVENAVKHGMNPYSGPLHILVRTRHTDTGSEITVEDDGPGFDPSDDSMAHTALSNIRQRLQMMCDGQLTFTSGEGNGTVVTITIPDNISSVVRPHNTLQ
jgi:signal transduction histidine kinase